MRFPSIKSVAAELRDINASYGADAPGGRPHIHKVRHAREEAYIDVRLQVYEDGAWAVRWGLSDYDQDHRGYWGASSVPGNNRRFHSEDVARDLISQAKDDYYSSR